MSDERLEAAEEVPWWEGVPKGQTIPLGFVKIDRVGSTGEWDDLPSEEVARRRDRYVAGVEWIARAVKAAQPLHWQGDGVILRKNPRLAVLARNPFMLAALALINRAEGRLPRHRVQFYSIFARALCETWANARRIVASAQERTLPFEEEAIPILGALAIAMHDAYPTGVAPREFVINALARALVQHRGVAENEARQAAEKFLERTGMETQILLERGLGRWGFLHLTFQEFFTAAGLHAMERFEDEAKRHLLEPRWEEVIRLGVGYLALVQGRPEAARRFVESVLDHQETGDRAPLNKIPRKQEAVAALLAAEAGDALPRDLQRRIGEAFARWVLDMPRSVSERFLQDIALTDFSELVAVPMTEALKDPVGGVRRGAAQALGALRAEGAVPALVSYSKKRLRHDPEYEAAVEALWRIAESPRAAPRPAE